MQRLKMYIDITLTKTKKQLQKYPSLKKSLENNCIPLANCIPVAYFVSSVKTPKYIYEIANNTRNLTIWAGQN